MKQFDWHKAAPGLVGVLIIGILFFWPTGYEEAVIYRDAEQVKARVVEVDDSTVFSSALIRYGEQRCQVELLRGSYKGQVVEAVNILSGSLANDKVFVEGDTALVVVNHNEGAILSVSMIDHYRVNVELILAVLFMAFLVVFAGRTGARAILSFVITVLAIWKILVPAFLRGVNPLPLGILVTILLTVVIITLVYGFERRSVAACAGAVLGVLTTCVLGVIFTELFQIHGAIMDYSETLLYSGYEYLNLTNIFKASIFIGASGAVMDLAVDITSSVSEVVEKAPHISRWEAAKSGMAVGRAAMGTMTTTLLLAYSGGYMLLLMVFMAQGTPVYNILNYKSVAAEILHTIVGSFGLVTVAPFTAITSGYFLAGRKEKAGKETALPDPSLEADTILEGSHAQGLKFYS